MFKHISKDLPAGLVVFLVAVPLCLGIALASGAPLFSGIIAGIVGGVIVALISGSHIGVSGPAAGLAVIVYDAIRTLGTNEQGEFLMEVGFPLFLSAVVVAGVIQIILAFTRAGIIAYFFPSSVIKGMLSGIGIIIILKQIPHALGHDVIAEGFDGFLQADGENSFSELWVALQDINPAALIITAISLTIMIIWEQKFIKRIRAFQIIKGPLLVVILGIILGDFLSQQAAFSLDADEMVALPIATDTRSFIGLFTTPDFSQVFSWQILLMGGTIALIASLETLLCVEATDKLDPAKNITPTNRELVAQGVGNIVSGFIGGLPITQVIVRSSANIQSGGRTKLSAFFHGVLILLSVLLIPEVMNKIPLASLASILLVVGYRLAKPALFKEMAEKGLRQFIPFIVTIVSIVLTDLLTGIAIGLSVGVFMILFKNYMTPFNFQTRTEDGKIVIKLSENVTFLNKASINHALASIPSGSSVMIDARKSAYIHPDVVEIIEDFKIHASKSKINLNVEGSFDEKHWNSISHFTQEVSEEEKKSYLTQIWNN